MKIKLQDSFAHFGLREKDVAQALQRVRKEGPAALFESKNKKKQQNLSVSESHLESFQRVATRVDSRSAVQSKVAVQSARTQVQVGNTQYVGTTTAIKSATQVQSSQAVKQASEQQVVGTVNGKAVFSHTSRDLQQTTVAKAATQAQENRKQADAITREITKEVDKKGTTTKVDTHIETAQERDRSVDTEAARRTETQIVAKVYDRAGNVVSEKVSRQAVSTTQATEVDQSVSATGTRDIQQATTVSAVKDGKNSVSQTRTSTEDTSSAHQAIDTDTTARTTTLVENLDANGKVISAKGSAQEVHTHESRSIDGKRSQETEQASKSQVTANGTETQSKTSVEIHAATVDRIQTVTEVENFNGDGKLVSEKISKREVTVATVEDRSADSQNRTSVTKEAGVTTTAQEISNSEQARVATRTSAVVDGVKSERLVTTEAQVQTQSELENRVDASGRRTVEIATEQLRRSAVDDLSINAKGLGKLVETETVSRQTVEGQLEFDPASNKLAPTGSFATIQFGSMTGLRSSFKMEEGVLEFDFSAEFMTSTSQETSSGQVVVAKQGDTDVAGPSAVTGKALSESVRFKGQIVASRDAAGNRVLDVDARVMSTKAAVAGHDGKIDQAELSRTEMRVDARLAMNRTSVGGTTSTQASGDLKLDRVETTEAAGTVATLQRLTSQDAFKAGFSLNNGALQFNFGAFNLGISLFA